MPTDMVDSIFASTLIFLSRVSSFINRILPFLYSTPLVLTVDKTSVSLPSTETLMLMSMHTLTGSAPLSCNEPIFIVLAPLELDFFTVLFKILVRPLPFPLLYGAATKSTISVLGGSTVKVEFVL